MENQTKNKQQAGNVDTATKKQSDQPTYGDKPWQSPEEYDREDSQDDAEGCGCDSGNQKGEKKDQPFKKGHAIKPN